MIEYLKLSQVKSRLGWAKDKIDTRDYRFPNLKPTAVRKVDLRTPALPVIDQGSLGSCTACAIASAYQFDLMKQSRPLFLPSRLFIYYNERLMEGTELQDSGAYIRDGIKSINSIGACPESNWPYLISKFAVRPPAQCYSVAARHKSVLYRRVTQSLDQMKAVLNSGFPFVLGFLVYESFLSVSRNRGYATMPRRGEALLGGHAVLVVGYDDAAGVFIVKNSWGTSWGDNGYFYVPYAYFTSPAYANDLWVITTVTG